MASKKATPNELPPADDLEKEVAERRAVIKTDGYPMSIGELVSMYRDGELDIHPEFQRFFRWSPTQKSRLIESLLLGIPVPSIFVSQRQDGVWDVVDGLQRLSTILEFFGELRDREGKVVKPLVLDKTHYLPSLLGTVWSRKDEGQKELSDELKRVIKRAKLDIKIVLRESTADSKYELFQRLNTGGSNLTPQEIRNCVLIMADESAFKLLQQMGDHPSFAESTALTDRAKKEQYHLELVSRFIALLTVDPTSLTTVKDLGEYITDSLRVTAENKNFDWDQVESTFIETFDLINNAASDDAFRLFDRNKKKYRGQFLISAFEAVALGVGYNVHKKTLTKASLEEKIRGIWENEDFKRGTGSGVPSRVRLPVTLAVGRRIFER